ncbi:MAG: hypothetical protein M0006_17590 [Magnetospirillum sp.]|nr:hypothetical protein [Magnetospirillum sp.]
MSFDVLATIMGDIADQAEAERLARDIAGVVARARARGCIVDIRDLRLGRELRRTIVPPGGPRSE